MTTIFAIATLLSFCPQAKEYHEYDYWSSYKTGSTVMLKMEMETAGFKMAVETNKTLLEVGPDKVVVEVKNKTTVNGKEQPGKTSKEEILKDKEKTPFQIEKEGDEEIDVAGKKVSCHWMEGTQNNTKTKFWISTDIPGGMVAAEVSGPKLPGVMKFSIVSWEKK